LGQLRSYIDDMQDLLADTEMDLQELMEREEEILEENEDKLIDLREKSEKVRKKVMREMEKDRPNLRKVENYRLEYERLLLEQGDVIRAIVLGRENIAGCELQLEY